MIKRLFLFSFITVLLISGVLYLFIFGHIRFNYPDRDKYPVVGIDVSHHQGEIYWGAVKSEKVSFSYIKATEGGNFIDPRFKKNWDAAAEAGLERGAYHFFTLCKSGKEQAKNFIDTVPVDASALPPVIDFEFAGNCSDRPERSDLLKEILEFAREIEAAYGKRPVFYVTSSAYNTYLSGEIADYRVWIRNVFKHPELERDWTLWQYADTVRINGVTGPVDHNVFNGTAAEFETFAGI